MRSFCFFLFLFHKTHYYFLVYSCCVDGVKAHRCLVSEWLPRGSLERCYRFTPSELFVRSDGAAARVLASAPAAGAGAAAAARYASGTTAAAIARGTEGECSFMYRYILRESCSQFDSLPLTSLTIPPSSSNCARHR